MRRSAALAALLLAGCGPRALRPPAAVPLRYAADPGVVRAWDDALTLRGEVSFGGMPQLIVVTLHARVEERVLGPAGPDGRCRVAQAWKMDPPEFDGMPLDIGGMPARMALEVWRAPDGETWSLTGTGGGEDGNGTIGWALRTLGGFFPLLPADAVAPGAAWTRTMTAGRGGAGLVLGFTGRFDGFDPAAPEAALLSTGGTADLAGPVGADAAAGSLSEFHLDHDGTVRFDPRAGAVIGSRQTGTLRLKAKAGKTAIGIRARFESVLAPAAATAPAGR